MTQSTSPQVLIYASIDAARAQMATHGRGALVAGGRQRGLGCASAWPRCPGCAYSAKRCSSRPGVADLDRTRLTVSACDLGLTGYELETALRDGYGMAVEAADPLNVLLNVTYGDSRDDVAGFLAAMTDLAASRRDAGAVRCATPLAAWPRFPRQVMTPA